MPGNFIFIGGRVVYVDRTPDGLRYELTSHGKTIATFDSMQALRLAVLGPKDPGARGE